jgi:hypothetical protein
MLTTTTSAGALAGPMIKSWQGYLATGQEQEAAEWGKAAIATQGKVAEAASFGIVQPHDGPDWAQAVTGDAPPWKAA